jgi:hypothetical protein
LCFMYTNIYERMEQRIISVKTAGSGNCILGPINETKRKTLVKKSALNTRYKESYHDQ